MPTVDIRYPAAPTVEPPVITQERFEQLATWKSAEWFATIAATMGSLYRVEGVNEALFERGKKAALSVAKGGHLTASERLDVGRAIVDHHLAIQHKKGLVVYQRGAQDGE